MKYKLSMGICLCGLICLIFLLLLVPSQTSKKAVIPESEEVIFLGLDSDTPSASSNEMLIERETNNLILTYISRMNKIKKETKNSVDLINKSFNVGTNLIMKSTNSEEEKAHLLSELKMDCIFKLKIEEAKSVGKSELVRTFLNEDMKSLIDKYKPYTLSDTFTHKLEQALNQLTEN